MTTTVHTAADAAPALAALGVQWRSQPLPANDALTALLDEAAPGEAARAQLVAELAPLLAQEIATHGWRSQDLVVLHPGTPGLEEMLTRFERPHIHEDDEVRYIVDGEGLFGFFHPDGRETVVRVIAGDYLRVPAGVEHRFTLTAKRRIKALRLFSDTASWQAHDTHRLAGPLYARC